MREVVVCGGGFSGLCAALSAAEHGARVTVIEKGDELGGSFVYSGGAVWTYGDDDAIRAEVPLADHRLTALLRDHLTDDIDWLEEFGVKVLSRGSAPLWAAQLDPRPTVETLARLIEEAGGRILLGVGLAGLAPGPTVVVRVVDRNRGALDEIECGGVVLATGGFQGSVDLVSRYLRVSPDSLLLRANKWSTGDALRAVLDCGGAITAGMDDFYGRSMPDIPDREIPPTWYRDISQYWGNCGVALNVRGERFADESESTILEHRLNWALAQQPRGIGFYLIDHEMARHAATPGGGNALTSMERARGFGASVYEADTLEELCGLLAREEGVPYERAYATVSEYQGHVRGDGPAVLYPPRRRDRSPLQHPPFRALKVRPGITFTAGGIAVDREMRVLSNAGTAGTLRRPGASPDDRDGDREVALPGIYAAGVDVGNLSHGGYIGGLSVGLVFGRVAGRNAARGGPD